MTVPEGVVAVLKPPGLTSSDVVTDIRRIFGTRRVGHAGTLDPGASGVLLICVERATSLFDYIVDKQKEYIAEIAFGAETDTQDSYGTVMRTCDKVVSEEEIIAVLARFRGEIEQCVPVYSALNQNGVKLYKLARQGKEIEEKRRKITVDDIEYLHKTGENRYLIRVCCSKGTYIRTICHDIGRAVGNCAHMSFLLRTRCGTHTLADAYSTAKLKELKEQGRLASAVIPPDKAVAYLPELQLRDTPKNRRFFLNGAQLNVNADDGVYRVYCSGEFLGLGGVNGSTLTVKLVLNRAGDE